MNKAKKIIIAMLVTMAVLVSSLAIAQGWNSGRGNGPAFAQQRGYAGPGRVLGEEMYNARIEVLAELSGQSQDAIKSKLEYKPMWAVLDELKVDFNTYQTKMHEKAKTVVSQAVTDGKLTKAEGDFMLERMDNAPGYGMGPRGGFGRGRGAGFGRGPCGGYNN